jgi:hypothetical protein
LERDGLQSASARKSVPDELLGTDPGLEKARVRRLWWRQHHSELVVRYPEQFVAVKDDDVVAADRDLRELARKVERLGLSVGTDVFVSFVAPRDRRLVL